MQFAGSALGAIGLSQLGLERCALRYGKALAQDTPRKLALLVGINDYPLQGELLGPVTDVELQKQLLIHRFKFHPNDIYTLTDRQATRQNILGAFDEYLFKQAREGDVVVFHFSGHGAQVQEFERMQTFLSGANIDCIDDSCQNSTLVPIDYSIDYTGAGANQVQDIMGHTLLLMRSALPTDNVTFVLDCCYSGGGKRGNVIMRSRVTDLEIRTRQAPQITPQEWEYQEQWLSYLGWGPQDFIDQIHSPQGKGIVVASAKRNQQSADYGFDGFYAGAFTYLLTQHLWQQTTPLSVRQTVPAIVRSTTRLSQHSQTPVYDPAKNEAVSQKPIYHVSPSDQPAEAVVLEHLANNRVRLWLGGLEPQSLSAFNSDAEFSLINSQGNEIGRVKQDAPRIGLTTEGQLISTKRFVSDQDILLQERIRQIPGEIKLRVGLDDTLTKEEKQIARELLQPYSYLEIHPVQAAVPLNVLMGRLAEPVQQRLTLARVPNLPALNSIGLFTPTQEPIHPGVFGKPDESIDATFKLRLFGPLKSLLVTRMLRLILNQQASKLRVRLLVNRGGSVHRGDCGSSSTTRGGDLMDETARISSTLSERGIEEIPDGDQVTITIQNNEPQDFHIGLLVIDAKAAITTLIPRPSDTRGADILRSGGSIRLGPLFAAPPYGLTELMVIVSTQSLSGPLRTLKRIIVPRINEPELPPNEFMQDLFGALDEPLRTPENGVALYPLDANQMTVLSLLYEVIPSVGTVNRDMGRCRV